MLSPSLAATVYQSVLQGALRFALTEDFTDSKEKPRHRRLEFFERFLYPWYVFESDLKWFRRAYRDLGGLGDFDKLLFDEVRIPVVGQTASNTELGRLAEYVSSDRTENSIFLWGRVPLPLLLNGLGELENAPPETAYLDLGTPLRMATRTQKIDVDISNLLSKTEINVSEVKCGVAIVDMGESVTHGPNDYNGKLRHAVTDDIDLSAHAKKVLATLLERIGPRLSDVTVSCALVRPPVQAITPDAGCFDQATTVELLDALKALEPQLKADGKPSAVNISLGTHVGPHNGDSPLEEYISTKLAIPYDRFIVAAAGNDGGSGLAAKRTLEAGSAEYIKLRTGPRCVDLLVEFWWYEPDHSDLAIKVELYERNNSNSRRQVGATMLRSSNTHQTLGAGHMGFPSVFTAQALFHSKCRNDLSCVAFSLSRMAPQLPILDVEFTLECTADTTVNAWIVLSETDPETTFIQGDADGTVRVPATANHVVSVAGNDVSGKMWINSSRGPSAEYSNGAGARAPVMSHLVNRGMEAGTSFASPRACADLLETVADPKAIAKCADGTDLVCERYSLTRATASWNRRSGYKKVTT